MSWDVGNQITASKLNSENDLVVHTMSVGNNTSATRTKVCFIHKPANPNQVIAHCWFHSLDGWWGHAANHYIKLWQSNSSGSEINLIVNKSWTSYQSHLSYDIKGSQIPASGWYKFYIKQADDWGGEQITMQIKSYPMSAVAGHQIIEYSSTGSRIRGNELTASKLNSHYITTF